VPRARRRTWSQDKGDGGSAISVDKRGVVHVMAKEIEQQLREA